jgi:Fe-S oxidoreductase
MDNTLIDHMKRTHIHPEDIGLMPEGRGFLIAEFGGDSPDEARNRAEEVATHLRSLAKAPPMKVFTDPAMQGKVWEVREAGLGATAFVPGEPDAWEGWEDSSVPVEHVGDYLRDLRALFDKYQYNSALYGHFGQGCIHVRINFDLYSAAGIEKYRAFTDEAAHIVCDKYHGSLSGEHGDGLSRGELLPVMFGPEIVRAFQEFKEIWDPTNRMNPGRVVNAPPRSENLRLGSDYAPAQPSTHFQYPEDAGAFARGTLRCVGVGACRRHEGGTMCPSYMVTRDEKHSTRGRAHLLFEMLQGETVTGGWKSDAVKESLDLCLACKGCKGDCPVHVDVATYKAEFLSHYYTGPTHRRPRQAFAFGFIDRWARLASAMPNVVNAVTQAPVLSHAAKWAANVSPRRRIPRFASRTFVHWFQSRPKRAAGAARIRVLLWPDTFNNHFFPETLAAAVGVLEDVGCDVVIPGRPVCCGRPLYDFGFLSHAKRYLGRVLDTLDTELAAGTVVVGIEPSCVSVFRDEAMNLLPHDERARRLHAQTVTLDDFLAKRLREGGRLPPLERKVLVHAHCHHRAIMKTAGLEAVLEAMGVDYTMLDSGCCGMAGAFGFERDKFDVSIAVGERVLLPAVRAAPAETVILADGFSCREQISQTTNRRAVHLAELVQLAHQGGAT